MVRRSFRLVLILAVLSGVFAAAPAFAGTTAPHAVTQWLQDNAVPLTTVEAGHGFADMEPLKEKIGGARVVALGEGTHGTREFFQFKHRMLELLVVEKGFSAFAIEGSFAEALAVNDFVLNGTGDPAEAIKGMHFWTWSTQEVLDMVLWMRAYNEDPGHSAKVKFYGFDMQFSGASTAAALAYLQEVDPDYAGSAGAALEKFKTEDWAYDYFSQPQDAIQADAAAIAAVLVRMDEMRDAYSAITGEKPWSLARRHVRVVEQCQQMFASPDAMDQMDIRDAAMAENALWLRDYEGSDARFVLWAHNGHVSFDAPEYGWTTFGTHLKEALGSDLLVIGAEFNRGAFQAIKMVGSSYGPLTVFHVKRAIKSSVNAALASAEIPIYVVDIRDIPQGGANGSWWNSSHPERSIGAAYAKSYDKQMYVNLTPPRSYDFYFFIDTTTAAVPLP